MKKSLTPKIIFLGLIMVIFLNTLTSCSIFAKNKVSAETMKGYIIDVHCFDLKPDPAADSKACLQMKGCAASGYGIAVPQNDGSYKFYFFDGNFAPAPTDSQLDAVNLINSISKKDQLYISVTGTLT